MIEVSVNCPHCGKSFMDQDHKVDNHPGVSLMAEVRNKRGWVRLSSLYGSYKVETEFPIPPGEITKFYCPHCNRELIGTRKCHECGASMVPLKFAEGGVVQICSRRGCKKHLIEFENLEQELSAFYNRYSLFFKPTK